jgi:hypothetical protein
MDTHDPAHHDLRPGDAPIAPLAEHLTSTAATLDIGQPAVDAVIARGRQRQQRTRAAIGTVSVLAVAGLSVTAITALSRPAERRVVGAAADSVPADDPTATDAPDTITSDTVITSDTSVATNAVVTADTGESVLVDPDRVWNVVDPDSSEAIATIDYGDGRTVVGDGPFLALSTAPGTSDVYDPVLWRSDDGTSWQPVATPPALVGRAIAAEGQRFFTLGTSPAAAGTGRRSDATVSSSADGGITWSSTALPLDTSGFDGVPAVKSVGVMTQSIAAGPEGVVVAVSAYPIVDFETILPAEAQINGYSPTPDGVDIFAASTCTTGSVVATTVLEGDASVSTVSGDDPCLEGPGIDRTIPWADLGVPQAVVDAMFTNGLQLFASTDGVTFDAVPLPSIDGQTVTNARLAHLDSGFVMLTNVPDGGKNDGMVFESGDGGRTWTATGVAPAINGYSFQGAGDQLVLIGSTFDGTTSQNAVAVRTDGIWNVTSLNDLALPTDGTISSIAAFNPVVGPTGVTMSAALIVDSVAEVGGVEMAQDGVVLRAEDASGRFQLLDAATRAEIGTVAYWSDTTGPVTMSPTDGSVTVFADDGSVRTTFTQDDLSNLTYGPDVPQIPVVTLLLHTADGLHWSRESLSDIAGTEIVSTGGIRVSGSQLVVAANTAERNADGSPHQVLLIGTPAG